MLLEGLKVLSFSHFLMGPLNGQILGDLGADVISVESLEGAFQRNYGIRDNNVDGQGMTFLAGGRSKRSLSINLKDERGLEIVRRLAPQTHMIHNNIPP